jgi:hypothetical protein
MRVLRFRDCVPEIAHFRVDVGDGIPACGKLVEIERKARLVAGQQQEGNVEPSRYPDGERRSLVLAE